MDTNENTRITIMLFILLLNWRQGSRLITYSVFNNLIHFEELSFGKIPEIFQGFIPAFPSLTCRISCVQSWYSITRVVPSAPLPQPWMEEHYSGERQVYVEIEVGGQYSRQLNTRTQSSHCRRRWGKGHVGHLNILVSEERCQVLRQYRNSDFLLVYR